MKCAHGVLTPWLRIGALLPRLPATDQIGFSAALYSPRRSTRIQAAVPQQAESTSNFGICQSEGSRPARDYRPAAWKLHAGCLCWTSLLVQQRDLRSCRAASATESLSLCMGIISLRDVGKFQIFRHARRLAPVGSRTASGCTKLQQTLRNVSCWRALAGPS